MLGPRDMHSLAVRDDRVPLPLGKPLTPAPSNGVKGRPAACGGADRFAPALGVEGRVQKPAVN
ncbi:MAG: hypothetical protein ACLQNE_03585 [Thermoguttaceae bacterium]